MVHPLLFLGLFAAKKVIVGGLLVSGSRYGWPRVYRRILEAQRQLGPAAAQPRGRGDTLAGLLARGMRLPAQAAALAASPEARAQAQAAQRLAGALAQSPWARAVPLPMLPGVSLGAALGSLAALRYDDLASILAAVAGAAAKSAPPPQPPPPPPPPPMR